MPEASLRKQLFEMLEMLTVVQLTEEILKSALNSKFTDFEDAIQSFSAESIHNIDMLVSRNTQDFAHSEVAVLTPFEALAIL